MGNDSYGRQLDGFLTWVRNNGVEAISDPEFMFESIFDGPSENSLTDILSWYWAAVEATNMKCQLIPLSECRQWQLNHNGSLCHASGGFYQVQGIRVQGTMEREVESGWDQPLLWQVGNDGGILGLLRQRHNDVPHYLVEAKEEPGNYNTVQISTTLQATYSNLTQAHLGRKPHFADFFLEPEKSGAKIIFDQFTSEDGGRLLNKRNRSMLVEIDSNFDVTLPTDRFRWVTLRQLKKLIREHDAIVAPHIRGILAAL